MFTLVMLYSFGERGSFSYLRSAVIGSMLASLISNHTPKIHLITSENYQKYQKYHKSYSIYCRYHVKAM